MRCQGTPEDGRCPIHNTTGDLFLCHACEEYRWPSVGAVEKAAKSSVSSSTSGPTKHNGPATRSTANIERLLQVQVKPAANPNKSDNANCVVGLEAVENHHRHISCDVCHDCYHSNCSGLSTDTFERLIAIINEARWVCPCCRNDNCNRLTSTRTTLTRTTEQIADMQTVITTLESEIDSLKASITTPLPPPPPPLHSEPTSVSAGICGGDELDPGKAVKVEIRKTITDLSWRKKNVVISGLPDPSDDQ